MRAALAPRFSSMDARTIYRTWENRERELFGGVCVELNKRAAQIEFGCNWIPDQEVSPFAYIIACCGGKAAVDKWYGWKAKNDESWRASDDCKRAYRVALKVSEGDHQAALLLVEWGGRMADAIVEKHWGQFHDAACELVERGKMKVEHLKLKIASINGQHG
jgi:hypothetical protein